MNIAGLAKLSTIDYPGILSAVVFANGCNYNCWYCHNKELLSGSAENIPMCEILEFLEIRRGYLGGIVISGGEPTVHQDLLEFIAVLKGMDYRVKLDTNGSNPDMLESCLNIVDYVAIDYKAPRELYGKVCGGNWQQVTESLMILGRSTITWEVRTTMIPEAEGNIAAIESEIGALNLRNKPIAHRLNTFRQHSARFAI